MSEDGDNMEHFDPNADPKERRRLRYEYRELIAETQSKLRNIFVLYLVFRWHGNFHTISNSVAGSCKENYTLACNISL